MRGWKRTRSIAGEFSMPSPLLARQPPSNGMSRCHSVAIEVSSPLVNRPSKLNEPYCDVREERADAQAAL